MLDTAFALYVGLSLIGVIVALIAMGAVYRSTRPIISDAVIVSSWDEDRGAISVSRKHLGLEHQGKSPVVNFYGPGNRRLLSRPLQISIEKGDGDYTYAGSSTTKAPGGGICVDKKTCAAIKLKLGEQKISETPIALKMNYPSAANLAFLLRDHPDMAVRASAWVFLLTSLFGIAQWILSRVLGV